MLGLLAVVSFMIIFPLVVYPLVIVSVADIYCFAGAMTSYIIYIFRFLPFFLIFIYYVLSKIYQLKLGFSLSLLLFCFSFLLKEKEKKAINILLMNGSVRL